MATQLIYDYDALVRLVYPVEGSGWKNPRRIYLLNYMIKELEK